MLFLARFGTWPKAPAEYFPRHRVGVFFAQRAKPPIESAVLTLSDESIPYFAQQRLPSSRGCGAAALAMVYASLGRDRSPKEIWQTLGGPVERHDAAIRTCRLARHALGEGLAAVAFQARDPWSALRRCWEQGMRVIVNHRIRPGSPLGHFSVLVSIGPDEVRLHDPQSGPSRRHSREMFLRLWLPTAGRSEIVGHVMVAISRPCVQEMSCQTCGILIPALSVCAGCGSTTALRPVVALGCVQNNCPERMWKYLFCPQCDQASAVVPSG